MNLKQKLLQIKEDSKKGVYGVDVMMADDSDMSDDQKKNREKLVLSMKDKVPELKAKFGDAWQKVMYATATKLALQDTKLDESTQIDELARGNDFQSPDNQFTTNLSDVKKSTKKETIMGKTSNETNPYDPWGSKYPVREVKQPTGDLKKACWKGYTAVGMKMKNGKKVPNCVPEEVEVSEAEGLLSKFISSKGLDPDKMDPSQRSSYSRTREFRVFKMSHSESVHIDDVKTSARTRIKEISASGEGGQDWSDELKEKKSKKMVKEDKYQDPQSASMTVGSEVSERKKQMSKSARIIKSIYKKKKVSSVKEDLYDHEKSDKDPANYGKKPNIEKLDDKKKPSDPGGKKPEAMVVMSGGTTMTGKPRDTVEINPALRNRPGQPKIGDGDKKDKKKEDKKK